MKYHLKLRSTRRPWISAAMLGLVLAAPVSSKLYAQAGESATQSLLDRARALEVRGRLDMASQTWQQVLLADPNNTEALSGLARAAKLSGNQSLANVYLDRLRAIDPNDPGIARIENLQKQQDHNTQLQQAGKLAQAGQYDQAMQLYRQVYGTEPPPGDSALAYYETEAATEEGRAHAIGGLRLLSQKFPADTRYQVQLGRILTYNPKTRAEGRKLLSNHPNDTQAVEALRQSLLWDAQNPATAGDIRAYLSKHNDAQLTEALKNEPKAPRPAKALTPEQQAALELERARSAEDQAGYRALNAKHLEEAERHFNASLAKNPDDANGLAGMGYIRMQQANFGGAISFLAQAKQDGARDPGLDSALATSHFWYTMGEGATALNENDLPASEKNYRLALTMRPNSPEALEALGGTLLRAQQFDAAEPVFISFVKVKPMAPHAWRGLFLTQYSAGNSPGALETERRMPQPVRSELMKDPLYLRSLASAYSSVGRDADAQRVLRSALDLPFPADATGLQADTQLQFAGLLQQANHLDQAAGLYRQVLSEDPKNPDAWKGLVRVEHASAQDPQAIQTIESMPPPVYEAAMGDPGFEQTVASIYQSAGKLDISQDILEKTIEQQASAGQKPSVPAQIQLAGIYLQRGSPQQAYPLYQRVLSATPDNLNAWKGLLSALHSTGRDREALAQIQQIPPVIRVQLESDVEYLQSVGSIYAGLGQLKESQRFLVLVQQYYVKRKTAPPADVEIQSAWLLYNGGNDAGLYRSLMTLGGRSDLSEVQRRTIQEIWSNWAVRRANQAAAAGHNSKSLGILNAAARAFPDNPGVLKALAGGYARAGQNKQAILIWKTQDLTNAPASDYKAAIGVALAADDTKDAETWLRFGLDAYPKDSQLLLLGAKFEQARGDTNRASIYYRASLEAMPAADPGAELATELSRPVPAATMHLPGPSQPQDLSKLLQPSAADAAPVDANPTNDPLYLPSFNNQNGLAPVPMYGQPGAVPAYPSGSTVVPSYMTDPSVRPPTPSRGAKTSLKDYVPQASADELLPTDATEMPQFATSSGDTYTAPTTNLSPSDYQQQQIIRLTQQAEMNAQYSARSNDLLVQNSGPLQLAPGVLTQNPSGPGSTAYQVGRMIPQQSPGEVYGSYVPYVPPSAVQVQLGSTPVQTASTNPEVTDILPTARYVPNAQSHRPMNAHADLAAANAAAIRRGQSNTGPIDGVSRRPDEDYNSPPTQSVQYSSQPFNPATAAQSAPQFQQPALPATNTTQNNGNQNAPVQNAPQQNVPQQGTESYGQQYPQPNTGHVATRGRTRAAKPAAQPAPAPVPAANGLTYPGVAAQPLGYQPYPAVGPSYTLPAAPTDSELVEKKVPPLRGYYDPNESSEPQIPLTERQQAERDLATLEASYSGWIGGNASARYRSGRVGLDRMTDLEASVEASAMIGNSLRLTVIPTTVFLGSGVVDPTVYTSSGTVLGSYLLENPVVPAQQSASGVGGEFQLATPHLAVAVGYTPYEFLIRNWTGRLSFQPIKHFTFYGERQPVKETQLSYAGLRDPGTISLVNTGSIWGGVVSTGGGVRFDLGNEKSGFYITADGGELTGFHVLQNEKFEGSAGAYFLARTFPGYGKLNIGASIFGEHYSHDEIGESYGVGGYFSPGSYFLAAIPVTFNGYYKTNFHYTIAGSVGVQTFQEEPASFYPLDPAQQTGAESSGSCTQALLETNSPLCGRYPLVSNTGLNYGINAEGAWRIQDNWYAGAYLSGNNTNNYNTITAGFFVRYMFRKQIPADNYPTGLFPLDGFRPIRVP